MSSHSAEQVVIDWPERRLKADLGSSDIHVWAASLEGDADQWAKHLATAELARAAAFHFELHRRRFIVGRGLLRLILSRYLGVRAEEVEFDCSANGKPELAARFAPIGLRFNLAHSADLAIMAVTRLGPVGVDLERIAPLQDVDELVARFFSARENAGFQQLGAEQKPVAFFNLWTRKEALLKATGEGIAHSLNLVEVSFLPGEPAKLLGIPEHLSQGTQWSLHALAPAGHFAAALAVGGQEAKLQCGRWNSQEDPAR